MHLLIPDVNDEYMTKVYVNKLQKVKMWEIESLLSEYTIKLEFCECVVFVVNNRKHRLLRVLFSVWHAA